MEEGRRVLNIPNALTGLRLLAVPAFMAFYLRGRLGVALAIFVGAMATDWLDGVLARVLKQFTRLGALLDPVADKALGAASLGLLCWSGRLPAWLLVIVLFREACILTAIWLLDRSHRAYAVRPTRYGKYSTFFVTATIVLALVHGARDDGSSPALLALALVAAECIAVSWAQYLWMWIGLMQQPPSPRAA